MILRRNFKIFIENTIPLHFQFSTCSSKHNCPKGSSPRKKICSKLFFKTVESLVSKIVPVIPFLKKFQSKSIFCSAILVSHTVLDHVIFLYGLMPSRCPPRSATTKYNFFRIEKCSDLVNKIDLL